MERINRKLSDILCRNPVSKKENTFIGIEIENETKDNNFEFPDIRAWEFHNEGSLRYRGFEFVLSKPMDKLRVFKSLDNLFEGLKNCSMTNSIRTSTHVHFDMSDYTYVELVNFVTVYWILEGVLSEFCGEFRKGNLFCLRSLDSSYLQQAIYRELSEDAPVTSGIFQNSVRYASVNFASIPKFGSIEFRLMGGVNRGSVVKKWVNILDQIRSFSLKFKDPEELLKYLIDVPAEGLLDRIFKETHSSILKESARNISIPNSIRTGVKNAYAVFSGFQEAKKDKSKLEKKTKVKPFTINSDWIDYTTDNNLAQFFAAHPPATINSGAWTTFFPSPSDPEQELDDTQDQYNTSIHIIQPIDINEDA